MCALLARVVLEQHDESVSQMIGHTGCFLSVHYTSHARAHSSSALHTMLFAQATLQCALIGSAPRVTVLPAVLEWIGVHTAETVEGELF